MEAINSFLVENYPSIAFVMIGCVIGGFVVRYHILIHDARDKVKTLPCDEHGKKLDEIPVILKKMDELPCDRHSEKLESISKWIMKKDRTMIEILAGRQSPIKLKPPGIALLEVSGGKKCIDDNLDFFISKLKKTNPLTPYDVEERSNSVIMGSTSSPIFNHIKNYLYFNPDTVELAGAAVEVSMFTVVYVMGLYLRDIYLEKHPELLPDLEPVHT